VLRVFPGLAKTGAVQFIENRVTVEVPLTTVWCDDDTLLLGLVPMLFLPHCDCLHANMLELWIDVRLQTRMSVSVTIRHDKQGVAELGFKRIVGRNTKESLECLSLIILKEIVHLAHEAADETVFVHQEVDWQHNVLIHPV